MQAIQIADGRTSLWQWDTGVRIKVYGCTDVDQMHFVTPGGIISRDLVDGECGVPDTALQTEGLLKMYAFDRTGNGGVTRCDFLLMVKARPKPADYIDPPDEYDNLSELAKRIAPLIPGGGGGPVTPEQIQQAVDNYLAENPVQVEETDPTVPGWAKAERKPTYTAEEVGAQPEGDYALKSDIPAVHVKSVNGKTGTVVLNASDVGALPADAEIVDKTARDGVATLSKEIEELKDKGDSGDASELVKSVSTINHVLDIKEGSATTASLIDFDTAAKKFEKSNGTEATRFVYDEANGYVNANQAMSSGNVFFAGQKLPVAEGEIYTVGAFIQFGDAATSYKINIGIEGQSVSRNLNAGSTGDPYIPGTWKLIKATFTVNAETASKENARISIIAINGEALPLYIRDLIVVAGDTLPEIGETTVTDSVRLVNIEKRLDSIEREIPASEYEWENPVKQFSALFNNTDNVESFLFFTDPHLAHYSGWEQQLPEYTDFIAKVYNKTPTTFCVCGGDWLGNSDTMEEACYKMGLIDSRMRSLIPDYCPIVGNHDTNYQGKLDGTSANGTGTLSVSTYRNLWFRREGAAYYRYQGATSAMYVLDSGVEASAMTDYRWQQIDWLAESLKAEQMPNAFIALHIIYASGDSTTIVPLADNAMTVAEAYNAQATITLNGKTYDFTGCSGKVRFVIGGHTHADATGERHNIPFVITTQTRQNGVPTFDLVLADYDDGSLHLVRIGDGESRMVTMA